MVNIKHICFTAFDTEERKKLSEKAINLGLIVDSNFEIQTEALIAARIGSDKYRLATVKEIPILTKDWLIACETEGELVNIEKYKLPCLHNCTISATGFLDSDRKQIRKLCEKNGASYSSSLASGYTHLICSKGGSDKYQFALSNNINVVTIDWLKNSAKSGYALDESDYVLNDIPDEERQKCIEIANKFKLLTTEELTKPSVKQSILQTQSTRSDTSSTESFSLSSQFTTEDVQLSLFHGLVFYLVGFPSDLVTNVRKYIRKYGGHATFTTNNLNYIIANENTPQEFIKNLKEKLNYDPPVVSYKWFLNCIESMQILPIEDTQNIPSNTLDDNNIDIDISEEDLADAMQSQSCVVSNPTEKEEKKLFSGFSFKLADNLLSQKQNAKSIIERNGGKIVNLGIDYDFIIYPESCKTPRENNPKIRTLKWLKDSDAEHIVKAAEDCILYVPTFRLALDKVKKENGKLLIVISGYAEQKETLQSIIEALGASTSKTMRQNTDILVCEKKSDKSDFAIKKNIPVVTEKWLSDSYRAGYFLSSTDYIFNPNNSTISSIPNSSVVNATTVIANNSSSTTVVPTSTDKNNDNSTSTTPIDKKSTNNNTVEHKKTEMLEKEEQKTPTKTIIMDENARDAISPHNTTVPTMLSPTTAIQVDTTALTNFKNKLIGKLPKKKDATTKAIEFSEKSDVKFVPKKNLETLTFFNSQHTSESNSLSHYGGTSEAENEYNEKVKNDRNRTTDFYMSLGGTFAETQVIDQDNELQKTKWKQLCSKTRNHFLLSSLTDKQKKDITKHIKQLGGEIDDCYVTGQTTHFIAGSIVQTEKFLCSVAAGIWILCPQYVEDSNSNEFWIEEESYQWINRTAEIKHEQKESIKYLVTAKNIQDSRVLPFLGMFVHFYDNTQFSRIVTAGGGKILTSITDQCTHIFVKSDKEISNLKEKYPNIKVEVEEELSRLLMTDYNEKKVTKSPTNISAEEGEKKKRKVTRKK